MLLTIARPRPTPSRVVGAYAFGAALKRLGKCGSQLWGELLAGVLYSEHCTLGVDAGRDPHGARSGRLWTIAFCTRFVVSCSRSACEPVVGASAGGLDGEAAFFCEGEERFGGFFRYEGEVDVFAGEGPLVGAAEQEQCFREVDRSGVDGVEAVDELAGVAVRIVAGDVEKRLRDRQRGAQFVGGVGCESLLFGDVRFQVCEHRVEGVGEFAELILAARSTGSGGRVTRSRRCEWRR